MAYGVNYRAGFASPSNRVGYLYIDKDGYSGAITDIKLAANGLKLSHVWESWDSPIIGLRLEFDIVNDKTDFFELLPLLSAEEKEYKIRVVITSPTSYTLFEGYLNCDTITQKYLHKQTIRFAASSYLSKLDNDHPVSIDTLQNKRFLAIIDEILISTGASYNIRVNALLHAEGDILAVGQTLFNKNGFYTELFWIDNIERTTALEILKKILTSFNCYIYWKQDFWYIERYEDIYSISVDFVEYTTGVDYDSTGIGTVVNVVRFITDVHTLKFIEQSQTQSVIPGMKTIQVNLQDKRLNNLVNGDLLGMTPVAATPPAPAYRLWQYTNGVGGFNIISWGNPRGIISNSVYRTMTLPFVYDLESGIFTSIKLTVVDTTTAINVVFKFVGDFSTYTGSLDDFTFSFRWNLRKAGTSDYICQSSEDTNDWNLYPAGAGDRIQIVTVEGSSFDKKNNSVEVSFTIPIGLVDVISSGADAGKVIGDQEFILGLLVESYKINDSTTDYYLSDVWFGDVVVTSTGTLQDNVIKGKNDNAKFLNKKEIGVDLYDGLGFDYKNSILRGASMEYRTERWGTGGGSAEIVARGVCWGVSANPVIAMSHTVDGTGTGSFVSYLTGLTLNQLYHIRAYMTDADGNTSYGDDKTFTTRVLAIGDSYRGGKVAYIYQVGDPGYDPDVQHGIVAALSDQYTNAHAVGGHIFWGSLSPARTEGPQAWGFSLGDGITNSGLIAVGAVQYSEYANKVCIDYVVGAYGNWYFPSVLELHKLYLNRVVIGGFAADWYWSSTEGVPGTDWTDNGSIIYSGENRFAWALHFGVDVSLPNYPTSMYRKNNWMRVRPIQYF
ncbi:MAG: hypothetical protein WC827_03900 [Candidatus Paceibacterota bacterium]|jgi:hypothetical protein